MSCAGTTISFRGGTTMMILPLEHSKASSSSSISWVTLSDLESDPPMARWCLLDVFNKTIHPEQIVNRATLISTMKSFIQECFLPNVQ